MHDLLLPPSGAEPGSVWLLTRGPDEISARWTGSTWTMFGEIGEYSPALLWRDDYRLADPHGSAAALSKLLTWRKSVAGNVSFERHCNGEHFVVMLNANSAPWSVITRHPTSELAAAISAVGVWEAQP